MIHLRVGATADMECNSLFCSRLQSGGGAKLRITRVTSYPERFRSYVITINGQIAGRIKANESKEVSVPSGTHEIVVKMDWMKSNHLFVTISDGEVLELECGSTNTGWRIPLSMFWGIIMPHKYFWLRKKLIYDEKNI